MERWYVLNGSGLLSILEEGSHPKREPLYASQLYPILNAEAFNKGQVTDFDKVGVKVLNPHLLEVTLHAPCPYFLSLCAFVTLFPTPVHLIEKHGDAWVKPEHLIGNGAFKLESWQSRNKIEMLPNEHYWDKQHVHLKRVTAFLYDEVDTYYKLFIQGHLDWITNVPSSKTKEASWRADYYTMPVLGTYFYRFNVNKKPLDDVRVRKALSMSINRYSITRQNFKGGQQPANFFCPPVSGYQHVEGLPYDLDLAKKLLTEAGFGPNGKEFPKLELLYNTSDDHKKIAEAITENWRENLGIQVSLRNTEWKIFLSEMNQINYDICRSSWFGDYGDPNTFFDLFIKDGGNNRTGWSHPQYDQWLKESQLEPIHEKRLKIFQKMEDLLINKELPIIPLYMYVNRGCFHQKFWVGMRMYWIFTPSNIFGWRKNNASLVYQKTHTTPSNLILFSHHRLLHDAFGSRGPFSSEKNLDPAIEAALKAKYHLDEPVFQQYLRFLSDLAQLELGPSFIQKSKTVNEIILTTLPTSLLLGVLAILIALSLGLFFGIIASLYRGKSIDYLAMFLAVIGLSLPAFVIGPILQLLFTITYAIFPTAGYHGLASPSYLVLPALTLGLPFAARIARLSRGGMLDVLHQDYIKTARARGLSETRVIIVHALKGALVPVASYLGPAIAAITTGSLVVEKIFQIWIG